VRLVFRSLRRSLRRKNCGSGEAAGVEGVDDVAVEEMVGAIEGIEEHGVFADAQAVEDGRADVGWREGTRDGVGGDVIGLADDLAAANSGSGKEGGIDAGPVVATGEGVGAEFSNARCPSEFAHDDHHGLIEQAGLGEVGHEGVQAEVESGKEIGFQTTPVVDVSVPGLDDSHGSLNDGDAGLDESTGEEERLAEFVAAVPFADFVGFLFDFEGVRHLIGSEE